MSKYTCSDRKSQGRQAGCMLHIEHITGAATATTESQPVCSLCHAGQGNLVGGLTRITLPRDYLPVSICQCTVFLHNSHRK